MVAAAMKNIFRFHAYRKRRGEPKRQRVRLPMGWYVKTQWRGEIRRRRFWDRDYGGDTNALRAAIAWLRQQNAELGKPTTDQVIRSFGAYAAPNGRKGTWRR
jgi:hypothetical protein